MNLAYTSDQSRPAAVKRRRTQPRYPLDALKQAVHAETDADLADIAGLTKNEVRNLRQRGVTWTRADELAVACDFLPWEVWPEWADVDPADWCNIPHDPEAFPNSHTDDDWEVAA